MAFVGGIDEAEGCRIAPPVADDPRRLADRRQQLIGPRRCRFERGVAEVDEIRHGVDRPEPSGRTRATGDGECLDHRCRPLGIDLGCERDEVGSPDLGTNSVEVGQLVGLLDRICDQGGEGGVRGVGVMVGHGRLSLPVASRGGRGGRRVQPCPNCPRSRRSVDNSNQS